MHLAEPLAQIQTQYIRTGDSPKGLREVRNSLCFPALGLKQLKSERCENATCDLFCFSERITYFLGSFSYSLIGWYESCGSWQPQMTASAPGSWFWASLGHRNLPPFPLLSPHSRYKSCLSLHTFSLVLRIH